MFVLSLVERTLRQGPYPSKQLQDFVSTNVWLLYERVMRPLVETNDFQPAIRFSCTKKRQAQKTHLGTLTLRIFNITMAQLQREAGQKGIWVHSVATFNYDKLVSCHTLPLSP